MSSDGLRGLIDANLPYRLLESAQIPVYLVTLCPQTSSAYDFFRSAELIADAAESTRQ